MQHASAEERGGGLETGEKSEGENSSQNQHNSARNSTANRKEGL
jgi:hypothetical protein